MRSGAAEVVDTARTFLPKRQLESMEPLKRRASTQYDDVFVLLFGFWFVMPPHS